MTKPSPGRYEIKYLLWNRHTPDIEQMLLDSVPGLCQDHPPRRVNNLYFDSEQKSAWRQTVDGMDDREKTRLRWYGEDRDVVVDPQFEIKSKRGALVFKNVFRIPSEFRSLAEHRSDWCRTRSDLLEFDSIPDAVLARLLMKRPFFANSYYRKYFRVAGPTIRVTVDTVLTYSGGYRTRRIVDPSASIVEVKFPPRERVIATHVVQAIGLRQTRMSKFVLGMSLFSPV